MCVCVHVREFYPLQDPQLQMHTQKKCNVVGVIIKTSLCESLEEHSMLLWLILPAVT